MKQEREFSSAVAYPPWVGEGYEQQQRKWLILGESHYGIDGQERQWTSTMVTNHINASADIGSTAEIAILSRVETLLQDQPHARDTDGLRRASEFWSGKAFYNYVTRSMEDWKQRPTAPQFRDSHHAFSEVVCRLRPDVVLVLGKVLWNALPGESKGWHRKSVIGAVARPRSPGRPLEIWQGVAEYGTLKHKFLTYDIWHPSYRWFRVEDWRRFQQDAMQEIDQVARTTS